MTRYRDKGFQGLEIRVSQNQGYLFGRVPTLLAIIFWGSYWGLSIHGNYHIRAIETNMDSAA